MKTTIPFSGFYESDHDYELDSALEQMVGDNSGTAYPFAEDIFDTIEWAKVHAEYTQKFAVQFRRLFQNETGIELVLTNVELDSPREYNFTTDRIFAEVSENTVKAVHNYVMTTKGFTRDLRLLITERFTSRSGFVSFYDNTLESWPVDVAEWDVNQVGTLIESALRSVLDVPEDDESKWNQAIGSDLMENLRGNGFMDDIIYEAMNAEGRAIVDRASRAREDGLDVEDIENMEVEAADKLERRTKTSK